MNPTGSSGNDDKAVSPVIGVLLMLAITVVLAAVIGVFVLNLGGGVNENVKAGASVTTTNGNAVAVTWNSNQNANSIAVSFSSDDCSALDGTGTSLTRVGDSFTSTSCAPGSTIAVVVTAIGNGDAESVVYNDDVRV